MLSDRLLLLLLLFEPHNKQVTEWFFSFTNFSNFKLADSGLLYPYPTLRTEAVCVVLLLTNSSVVFCFLQITSPQELFHVSSCVSHILRHGLAPCLSGMQDFLLCVLCLWLSALQ